MKGIKYKDPMFTPHEIALGIWLAIGGAVCGMGVWQLIAAQIVAGWALLAIGVNVLGTACIYGMFRRVCDRMTKETRSQTRMLLEMLLKEDLMKL